MINTFDSDLLQYMYGQAFITPKLFCSQIEEILIIIYHFLFLYKAKTVSCNISKGNSLKIGQIKNINIFKRSR